MSSVKSTQQQPHTSAHTLHCITLTIQAIDCFACTVYTVLAVYRLTNPEYKMSKLFRWVQKDLF